MFTADCSLVLISHLQSQSKFSQILKGAQLLCELTIICSVSFSYRSQRMETQHLAADVLRNHSSKVQQDFL